MQIVTVQFNYFNGPDYSLLLDVFRYSVNKYMPEAKFIEYKIEAPKRKCNVPYNFIYNTDKLKIWLNHIKKAKENLIFADCDMMMIRSAKHAFDLNYDIAYTQRTHISRIPMNGGIVMVRPNERSIQFFQKWYDINKRMLEADIKGNTKLHGKYRRKWAGMNQAAFGWMMEHTEQYSAKVIPLETIDWNAVDCDWHKVKDGNTVFVHYKSRLRKFVLGNLVPSPGCEYVFYLWRNMLAEMKGERPVQIQGAINYRKVGHKNPKRIKMF